MTNVAPAAAERVRRQSTVQRYDTMTEQQQHLAFAFRSLPSPRLMPALAASIACCVMLQLTVAAPYAANERAADRARCGAAHHIALRGLIVGVAATFFMGNIFLVTEPIVVSGEFRRQFLLSIPVLLSVGAGAAFIPIAGSTVGFMSILIITAAASYVLCTLCLSMPLFATHEHMALALSVGPPLVTTAFSFFGNIVLYVYLTRRSESIAIGFLFPVMNVAILHFALFLASWSCEKRYYKPKAAFLAKFAAAQSVPCPTGSNAPAVLGALAVPPILDSVVRVGAPEDADEISAEAQVHYTTAAWHRQVLLCFAAGRRALHDCPDAHALVHAP
jgi:hypothetical protein